MELQDYSDSSASSSTGEPYKLRCCVCGAPKIVELGEYTWSGVIRTAALRFRPDRCDFCTVVEKGLMLHCQFDQWPPVVTVECHPGESFIVDIPPTPYWHELIATYETGSMGMMGDFEACSEQFRVWHWIEDPTKVMSVEFYTLPGQESIFPHLGSGRNDTVTLDDDGCMEAAREWIQQCKASYCCYLYPHPDMVPLPKRVIDVGDDRRGPYLVDSEGKTGWYTTLSHCWGIVKIFGTTKLNLQARTQGIHLFELPKTFQDAISITRRLGIKYIWIDSLCILQDSKKDWEEQSANMHQIYQNSYLTIAATSAKNASEGCFVRKTLVRARKSFQVLGELRGQVPVFVRSAAVDVHKDIEEGFLREPLSMRGWTYQEGLLSPRVLNFSSSEISWECKRKIRCYCRTKNSYQKRIKRIVGTMLYENNKNPISDTSNDDFCAGDWRHAVELYSIRNLSFESDTLPALAGLASTFPQTEGNPYLAGLWRFDLHQDLLWSQSQDLAKVGPGSKKPFSYRPTKYIAPSWSWASIQGAVNWQIKWLPYDALGADWFSTAALIVDARCEVQGRNPWGEVFSGFLLLEAPLTHVKLRNYEITERYRVHRCEVGVVESESAELSVKWIDEEWAALDSSIEKDELESGDYWCVEIATRDPPSERLSVYDYAERYILLTDIDKTHAIYYHLLVKRSLRVPEAYERIGMFIKTVAPGTVWKPGPTSTITIV